jgi:hypothetical protein
MRCVKPHSLTDACDRDEALSGGFASYSQFEFGRSIAFQNGPLAA